MPVETFTTEQFSAALQAACRALSAAGYSPKLKAAGIDRGEYCFTVQPFADKPYAVLVRSSVKAGGTSAACGEDSIRFMVYDLDAGAKVGGSVQRWTTRQAGWQARTEAQLLVLAGIIGQIAPCPHCGELIKPFRVRKDGPNKGKCFLACGQNCPQKFFKWLDDETTGERCGVCDSELVKRTSNSAANPGRDYFTCPAKCNGSFRWADEPSKPAPKTAPVASNGTGRAGSRPEERKPATSERSSSKGQARPDAAPPEAGDAWEGTDLALVELVKQSAAEVKKLPGGGPLAERMLSHLRVIAAK